MEKIIAIATHKPAVVGDYFAFGWRETERGKNRFGDPVIIAQGPEEHALWHAMRLGSGMHGATVIESADELAAWVQTWGYVREPSNPFREGQRITVIGIGEMLATTHRREVTVKSVLPEPQQTGYGNKTTRYGTYAQRGKRKQFYLQSEPGSAIYLDGWDLPIRVDTDMRGGFCGNACFNLVGEPEELKRLIESAIIPVDDETRAQCLWNLPTANFPCDGELLYPDIETGHAIVNGIKSRNAG